MQIKHWILKLLLLNLNTRTHKNLRYQYFIYIFPILGSQNPFMHTHMTHN